MNEDVEVVVMPFDEGLDVDVERIVGVVRDALLLRSSEPYAQARVEVREAGSGFPCLIVSLAHRHKFMVKMAKVVLSEDYQATKIDWDFSDP